MNIDALRQYKPERIFDLLPLELFRNDLHQVYNPDTGHGFINNRTHYEWYWAIGAYVGALRKLTILEVGVRYGYAGICLAKPGDHYYLGIDDESYERNSCEVARENFERIGLTNAIIYNKKFSEFTMDRHYDVIHIDGDHSYDGALFDLNKVHGYYYKLIIDDYAMKTVADAVMTYMIDKGIGSEHLLILENNIAIISRE